eukprot:6208233-Pleurochrysis_carterae.AAC.4
MAKECRSIQSFTKATVAVNNPTPLYVDGNNIGLTVVCGFDVTSALADWALLCVSHVIFDADSTFAVVVADSEAGVSIIRPYGWVLLCDLATLSGSRELSLASLFDVASYAHKKHVR